MKDKMDCIDCGNKTSKKYPRCYNCNMKDKHKCQSCDKMTDKKYPKCYTCKQKKPISIPKPVEVEEIIPKTPRIPKNPPIEYKPITREDISSLKHCLCIINEEPKND
jgi:hypothetical protein